MFKTWELSQIRNLPHTNEKKEDRRVQKGEGEGVNWLFMTPIK